MGLSAKYDEILDDTVLRGIVARGPLLASDDGDWIVFIDPAQGYEGLLRNPDGYINNSGKIECEVEPPDDLPGGKDAESGHKVVKEFMGPIEFRRVRLVGTWTRDRQHTVDGSTVLFDALGGDKGKTEIHPITSLLGKLPRPNARTRRFVFLVFSDDSAGLAPTPAHQPETSIVIPPHAGENRRGDFRLAVPQGSNITKVVENASKAGSALVVTTEARGSFSYVKGSVTSGKPKDGKGFYHLVFDVPALFSLRAFFESEAYRGMAPLVPMTPECKAIQDKLNKVAQQFSELVSKQVKDKLLPLDAPGAEKLLEEKKKLQQQLHACLDKRKSVRPVLPEAERPCDHISYELQQMRKGEKFDKDLKEKVDVPASPEAIAAKEKELAECLKSHIPPGFVSLKDLIESAYP